MIKSIKLSLIKDIWIVERSGLCMFDWHDKKRGVDFDSNLVAPMMNVLMTMWESIDQDIKALKMSDSTIYFRKREEFVVVTRFDSGINRRKAKKEIDKICETFNNFINEIGAWNNKVDKLRNFEHLISSSP